jgi:hypothetical protein
MAVAVRKRPSVTDRFSWERVFEVERRLLHRKLPLTESTLMLLERGINNGKQKALERAFDANKMEILEGINRARDAKSVDIWHEAFKRMESQKGQLCNDN